MRGLRHRADKAIQERQQDQADRRPVRVLVVATHPIQYMAPLYRRYQDDPRVDVTIAYCSLQGAHPGIDPEFGTEIAWDVPQLLDGYRWLAPKNVSPWPDLHRFLGLINPAIWGIVRRGKYDIVVCPGYAHLSSWIAALSARWGGIPFVWESDAQSIRPASDSHAMLSLKRLLVPRIYRFADGAFMRSTRGELFARSIGVESSRVFLVPYVVDNAFFSSRMRPSDREVVRQQWGIPESDTVALFVGKLVPRKRPQDLIAAVAQLTKTWAVFIGDGKLRSNLEDRAGQLGILDRVRFQGFANQQELPRLYAAADVLVLPSEFEPFGLVVNEAFAVGTPAIVTDKCGVADDLVMEGTTGYVYRAGSVEDLAAHLRRLSSDPRTRARLSDAARELVSQWGPQQNADAFADACNLLSTDR